MSYSLPASDSCPVRLILRKPTIKYRIFGHPRLLLRRQVGAHTELSLAVMAYNLKRMANVLGNAKLPLALQTD